MICGRCGAKNSDGRKKCFHCGYVFPTQDQTALSGVFAVRPAGEEKELFVAAVAPENEDAVIEESATVEEPEDVLIEEPEEILDDADETAPGEDTQNTLAYTEVEPEEEPGNEPEDEPENEPEEGPESEPVRKDDGITHLALDRDKSETYYESSRRRGATGFTIVIWLLSILFIIVLLVVGVLIFQYITENDDSYTPPETTQIALTQPQIERVTDENGDEAVHAVFYGAPGDRLYLGCNDRYYTFLENSLTLDLRLEDLFSSEYEFLDSTVNANLNAYHVRDNKRYKYETAPILLHVPAARLTLLSVPEGSVKVYRDKFTVQLWTETGSQVFLNNTNITSFMDGTGIVSYDVDVPAFSTKTYEVRVTQPYHTAGSSTFILMRDALPVSLTLATSNASLISDNTITITGSTEQDAVITSSLPILSLEKNDIYNTYTAVIDLSSLPYGRQEVLISATNSKGSSTRSHIFWYWPDEKKVTTTANRFDSAVATNANAYARRNYVLNNVTVKKIAGANRFEAVCSINGVDYPVLLTYEYRTLNVQIEGAYKIFAVCEGASEEGVPMMRVWYMYKQ